MAEPSWLDWGTEAFRQAHALRRPVVLSIVVEWSDACGALDRTTFAAPSIVERIGRAFVPVRVDAMRRPDIADRYTLGGWPTVAFLSPDGDLLGGGTWVDADALAPALDRLASEFAARWPALRRAPAVRRAEASPAELHSIDDLVARCGAALLASFDARHGTFGPPPREAPGLLVRAALACWRHAHDDRLLATAERTLDAVAWGGLWDEERHLFFRAATGDNWTGPDTALLTDVQAGMLLALVDAWAATGQSRYAERAHALVEAMDATLRTLDGAFAAHPGGTLVFTDVNARASVAWLAAARAFDAGDLVVRAIDVLDRVAHHAYERNAGVAHDLAPVASGGWRPRTRGLLVDQVGVAEAALAAHEASGAAVYLDLADELARSAWRRFWNDEADGLVDRVRTTAGAGDVGLLADVLVPESLNATACRVLTRLGRVRADPWIEARADDLRRRGRAAVERPLADLAAWTVALV